MVMLRRPSLLKHDASANWCARLSAESLSSRLYSGSFPPRTVRLSRARSQLHRPSTRIKPHRIIKIQEISTLSNDEDSTDTDATTSGMNKVNAKRLRSPNDDMSLKPRKLPSVVAPWSDNITLLRSVLADHMRVPPLAGLVPPGYHCVSHNAYVHESELCEDGADMKYSPGPEWRFRVWLGTYMELKRAYTRHHQVPFMASEFFASTRLVGRPESESAKAIVSIGKTFDSLQPVQASSSQSSSNPSEYRAGRDSNSCVLYERKKLCFMKKLPESLKSTEYSDSHRILVPGNPLHEVSMIPTQALLFRFSALTNNSHFIHLDTTFAKEVYGIPNLLVHGPLTVVLMLEIVRQYSFRIRYVIKKEYVVRTFETSNRLPLWVDEEISIGCKKTSDLAPSPQGNPMERWEVWISKGQGRNATLAVSGVARIEVFPLEQDPPRKFEANYSTQYRSIEITD